MSKSQRSRYSCQQDLAVFHLFLQLMEGQVPSSDVLEGLSRGMKNHNSGSIRERLRNFVSVSGLEEYPPGFTPRSRAANLTKKIWDMYGNNPGQIREKASAAYSSIMHSADESDEGVRCTSIQRFKVTGLFGRFDHELKFRFGERIIIIIGPNGFGKTMTLRMIDNFFNKPLSRLARMPFRKMEVAFDDGSVLVAEKSSPKNVPPGEETEGLELALLTRQTDKGDFVKEITHYEHGIAQDFEETAPRIPEWLQAIRDSITVKFINTERLTRSSRRGSRSTQQLLSHWLSRQSESFAVVPEHSKGSAERTVSHYSDELAKRVQETLTEYGSLSQSLDRMFPSRIVTEPDRPDYSAKHLLIDLAEIEEKHSNLVQAGLIARDERPMEIPDAFGVDQPRLRVLAIYAENAKKKLGVFDNLYKRVRAFLRIANSRFLYKRVMVGANGLNVVDSDNLQIDLEMLSSGEQHELVILYELLFRIPDNSLILIDEPELSLHVQWQEQFLEDIEEMATLSNFRVILATHSPEIVGERWDLTAELHGPNEK